MPGQLLEFFGLQEHPFGVSPNPRYLYLNTQHGEALAALVSGIENSVGFSALIAEPGLGKTALLRELLRQFKDRTSAALISNTQCNGVELLRSIVMELQIPGGESEHDPTRLHRILSTFAAERQQTKPVVIIIDEAQDLEDSALETLRLLSNLEAEDRKLLHIILAGQPELRDILRNHSQLFQRITVMARLSRFSPRETEECIQFRLRTAGYSGAPLFSKDAMARIKQASRGVPREINRICLNALDAAFAARKKQIGIEVIEQVLSDLDLGSESASESSRSAPLPETASRSSQVERWRFEAPPENRAPAIPADTWVVDPFVDIGLGDEVIESVLSGLPASGELRTQTPKLHTEHLEAVPQNEVETLDGAEKPRISYAQAGTGPSDDEIRALFSEAELNVSIRKKAPKSREKKSQFSEVKPADSSAPIESTDFDASPSNTSPDPRVLKLFAPRKPSEVPVRRIDSMLFDAPPEPVAYREREEPWNTGVPRDPFATMSAFVPPQAEQHDTGDDQQKGKIPADSPEGEPRNKIIPIAIWLCVIVAALVILYFALPYLSS